MSELVSILIPTYNGERHVGAALASAQAQTYEHLEILVGDDGSSDATRDIVRDAASRDPRIQLIAHPENLGAPANQIALHEAARGTYVKPLLQDDLLRPASVRRLVAPLAADPSIAAAFGRRDLIDDAGATLPDQIWNRPLADADTVLDGWELVATMLGLTQNLLGEVTCALYRRDAVGDPRRMWHIGDHQYGPIGDVALWLHLLAQGRAFYTPEVLSSFRQHGAQASHRPEVMLRGMLEWCLIATDAPELGHLSSPRAHRDALTASIAMAANGLRQAAHDPVWSARLREGMQRALARLAEPDLQPRPARYPVAIAAPAVDPAEILASVRGLRALAQDAVVDRCVIAVPADAVSAAVPHVEHALGLGPDFDLELQPTDAPGTLVAGPWLAVVSGEDAAWASAAAETVRTAA